MMGEILGEVFSLSAVDQETMKQWTARVKESFEKCKRRAAVCEIGPSPCLQLLLYRKMHVPWNMIKQF